MTANALRLTILIALTMTAFAANSILTRLALADRAIDASSYTFLRLAFGAVVLAGLVMFRTRVGFRAVVVSGHWMSAGALFVYAAGFSFAYLALDTGMGALILFAMVQATMIGWSLYRGDRPLPLEWLGLITAFGAFIWLVSPGLSAPDPLGTALMAAAGIAWGVYSLRGRATQDPLAATAGNFVLAAPLALVVMVLLIGQMSLTWMGVLLAFLSGAIMSGLGYALWYSVLPQISATQAAIVQLTVPVIAALGGVLFASEAVTLRFGLASALILGGVALAITAKARRA